MNSTLRALFSASLVMTSLSFSFAQLPFQGNLIGSPYQYDVPSSNAMTIYANSDGSNDGNEFLYFKIYEQGKGSDWQHKDWYSNPTAWMDHRTFHFSNLNLKMYKNNILLNKGGVIDFGADLVKEPNAGTITYGKWAPGLNIHGGNSIPNSTSQSDRKLVVFAEAGSIFNGPIGLTTRANADMPLPKTLSNGANLSTYRLYVDGGILAKEIRVNTSNWADYVFSPAYKLKSLANVEAQIRQLGHLPGMPSAKEIETDGFNVSEIARLQQEKIEELTLYVIALKKEIDGLKRKAISRK